MIAPETKDEHTMPGIKIRQEFFDLNQDLLVLVDTSMIFSAQKLNEIKNRLEHCEKIAGIQFERLIIERVSRWLNFHVEKLSDIKRRVGKQEKKFEDRVRNNPGDLRFLRSPGNSL